MASTARLRTAGRGSRHPDGREAGQSSDVGVGDRLTQDLLGCGSGRGLLSGRRRGDVAVGVTAAAVVS